MAGPQTADREKPQNIPTEALHVRDPLTTRASRVAKEESVMATTVSNHQMSPLCSNTCGHYITSTGPPSNAYNFTFTVVVIGTPTKEMTDRSKPRC